MSVQQVSGNGESGSLWRTVKAVGWSFVGIRKRSASDEDMARITPMHLVAVGFAAVIVLVLALIGLVNWVVAK